MIEADEAGQYCPLCEVAELCEHHEIETGWCDGCLAEYVEVYRLLELTAHGDNVRCWCEWEGRVEDLASGYWHHVAVPTCPACGEYDSLHNSRGWHGSDNLDKGEEVDEPAETWEVPLADETAVRMDSALARAKAEARAVSLAEAWDEFCASRDWELSCPIFWRLGSYEREATLAVWWGDAHENPDENGIAVTAHFTDGFDGYCEMGPLGERWTMDDIAVVFGVPTDAAIWDVELT